MAKKRAKTPKPYAAPDGARAVLLCCGPSLLDYPGRQKGDVIIACNRAAGRLVEIEPPEEVDFFVTDHHDFPRTIRFLGSPTAVCPRHVWDQMCRIFPKVRKEWDYLDPRQIATVDGSPRALQYSATIAPALAAHLGFKDVLVYGADWSGTQDYDGRASQPSEAGRTPERWKFERALWAEIVSALAKKGVVVRRHGEDESDGG